MRCIGYLQSIIKSVSTKIGLCIMGIRLRNQEYNITFGDYYWRGKRNLEAYRKLGAKPNLFYSAFEFRCCIERLLLEYLVLLKIKDIPKSFLKLYRAKDIGNTILEIEPDFHRKIEFMNIYLEALEMPNRVFLPDLKVLNHNYGQIGNYLHAQKEPKETVEKTEWWSHFQEVVEEAEKYLGTIKGYDFGSFDLSERGEELFVQWKEGKLSNNEIIKTIRSELRIIKQAQS